MTGTRLADYTTHAAPIPDADGHIHVPPGAYYRILHNSNELPTPHNTHAWVVRTPDGEWGSVRIGERGATVEEHEDGTITVTGTLTTPTRRTWRLERGEWAEVAP